MCTLTHALFAMLASTKPLRRSTTLLYLLLTLAATVFAFPRSGPQQHVVNARQSQGVLVHTQLTKPAMSTEQQAAILAAASNARMAAASSSRVQGAATQGTFWIGQIAHTGTSPYNPNPSTYKVYRNVMDYGAKGDGVTDDTDAINTAIADGARCGYGCDSSTITPALVYFPPGKYLVSKPIISYYYTQLVGDYNSRPTLLASPSFSGIAVIDEDPYVAGGANWFTNQNNLCVHQFLLLSHFFPCADNIIRSYREVRNFVIDLTQQPTTTGTGIHHQVSQATGLYNVKFVMRTESNTAQQGIFMENGSGGLLRDLEFVGGRLGAFVGNQQFTVHNVTFSGQQVAAIEAIWDWGWTWHNIQISNCATGMILHTGTSPSNQAVASELIVDWTISNTPVAFDMVDGPAQTNTLILENIHTNNVGIIVRDAGATVLAGSSGSKTIANWVQGRVYKGTTASRNHGPLSYTTTRSSALTDSSGKWYNRPRPQYGDVPISNFVSVKDHGAKGDGATDDTQAIQAVLNTYGSSKVIFVPQGTYIITSTLKIPIGTRLVGEVWSVWMGSGSAFQNMNSPTVIFQVGSPGDSGVLEITDMIFTTRGPAAGAIIMEWNVRDASGQKGTVGMWDCDLRIGGFAGTNLESNCPKGTSTVSDSCRSAFLSLHVTSQASGYFDNIWIWVADHDLDGANNHHPQLNIYNGRGVLIEAQQGPVWLWGTSSEHSLLYQYNIVNAKNVLIALGQTETPYMQGIGFPTATASQPLSATYNDPTFPCSNNADPNCNKAWSTVVTSSSNVYIYGLGAYSFFDNYNQDCLTNTTPGKYCQRNIVAVNKPGSNVYLYNVNTVGTEVMLVADGQDQAKSIDNINGFTSTLAAWIPA